MADGSEIKSHRNILPHDDTDMAFANITYFYGWIYGGPFCFIIVVLI